MLLLGTAGIERQSPARGFFWPGRLFLIPGWLCRRILSALGVSQAATRASLTSLSVRNAARRRRRSLATLGYWPAEPFLSRDRGIQTGCKRRRQQTLFRHGRIRFDQRIDLPIVQDLNTEKAPVLWAGQQRSPRSSVRPNACPAGRGCQLLELNRAQKPRARGCVRSCSASVIASLSRKWLKAGPAKIPGSY